MDIPLHVTTTDLDTMRRAVLLDPADDLARLAYADALEEAGDVERAEFVRLGVPHGKEQGRETFGPVGLREEELVSKNAPAWLRDIIPPGAKYLVDYGWGSAPGGVRLVWRGVRLVWRRGFIESTALPLAAFMDNAEVLFRAHPITAVRLTDRESRDVGTAEGGALYAWLKWSWDYMKTVLVPRGTSRPYDVPHELLRDGPSKWLYFDTPELARDALSAACVAYGRRKAGLPPLPVHPPADTGRHAR